jgi:hypothetical protein
MNWEITMLTYALCKSFLLGSVEKRVNLWGIFIRLGIPAPCDGPAVALYMCFRVGLIEG